MTQAPEQSARTSNSMKLFIMRKKAISWMMYDADLKKKLILRKKLEQAKVKNIGSYEYKKRLAVAG